MPRGETYSVGAERVAQNGYHYIKTKDGWRLKHHIIAEENLGRPIDTSIERVLFKNRKRDDFDPSNIIVEPKGSKSVAARRAILEARREEIEAKLAELDEEAVS